MFSAVLRAGETLSQIRLYNGRRKLLDKSALEILQSEQGLVTNREPDFSEERLLLHLDLRSHASAVSCGKPIELWRRNHYATTDYFRNKSLSGDSLILEPGETVLLCCEERLSIPPNFCAELKQINLSFGQFKTHDAGFFDPGFGWNENPDKRGSSIVLELTNFGRAPIMLKNGQRIAVPPTTIYGPSINSNYQGQLGIRYGKQFKQP
jgi:dCTP deaminase